MPSLKTVFVKSEAAKRRGEESYRDSVIAALGWEPEIKNSNERYAATTGEMTRWLRETNPEHVEVHYVKSSPTWFHPPAGTVWLSTENGADGWGEQVDK